MKQNIFFIFLFAFPILVVSQTKTQKINEVFDYINYLYVDDVQGDKLIDAAIVGMLEELDPHSTYIDREEVEDANQSIVGSFVGIGVRFQMVKDTFTIIQTISGGPSEKVGLRAGDKIIQVDEEPIAGQGLKNAEIRKRLMGKLHTQVNIAVRRAGEPELLSYIITRDKIPVHSVDVAYMIDHSIGYIKLNSFSRTTIQEVEQAIAHLKTLGMTDLIFDLQNNGGGLLSSAHELADEFLSGDKMIVYSEGRVQPRQEFRTEDKNAFEQGRLIILINENSASASEIVSGAIQDWDRGLIVGRRTFGKGLVQRPINLSDGSQIRLTIARYYTPSGRFIQKPYDNTNEYKNDLSNRYEHGEYYHADSIKLPDSLKVKTLIKKRTVYGGGGIMPDVFVPYDTSQISTLWKDIVRNGAINSFITEYVNGNRAMLKQQYPNFDLFKLNFDLSKNFMDSFFQTIEEEYEIEKNEGDYMISEDLIKLNMKAVFAQNLFDIPQFYEVVNENNQILKRAIDILRSDEYRKAGLATN